MEPHHLCPYCQKSICTRRMTCPYCYGKVYRKLVQDEVTTDLPKREVKQKGRPKKEAVELRSINFEGLDQAIEGGDGKLRIWRQSRGLSQSDMATILEITKQHYQRIEGKTGKISPKILGRIFQLVDEEKKSTDTPKTEMSTQW